MSLHRGDAATTLGSEGGGVHRSQPPQPSAPDPNDVPDRFGPYRELSRVMTLTFVRDKGAIFFLLFFPLLFLVLFGVLFRGGAGTVQFTVVQVGAVQLLDSATGDRQAELAATLDITRTNDRAAALERVREGDIDGVIEQRPDGTLSLGYSTTDPTRAAALRAVMNSLVQRANVDATGQPPLFRLDAVPVENDAPPPIQYLTPGLLGWAIATGAVFSSAMTLTTLRRRQLLRRIRLAPVSVAAVVCSRMLVTTVIALIQTALFLGVATLPFFGLRLSTYWWLIIPLVLCGTVAFMTLGMLAGAVAKTEESANGLAQLLVLPMSFLSGSFFSLENAPDWLRLLAQTMPLRHLVVSSEAVLTRGAGFIDVLPTLLGLVVFAGVMVFLTTRVFSWED